MLQRLFGLYLGFILMAITLPTQAAEEKNTQQPQPKITLAQTVVKLPLEEGLTISDAIESMKLHANSLNMKLVAHLPLSKELKAQGVKDVRHMEIFQFCDAKIAKKMVDYDISFSAYLPCRISVIEDKEGKIWLTMLNMDLLLSMVVLDGELMDLARRVRNNMNAILEAGASGAL